MSANSEVKATNVEPNIVMNPTEHWPSIIEEIAGGPFEAGGNLTAWLDRVWRKIEGGVSFWHVKQLYKGELTDPKHSISYKVLSAAARARLQEAKRDGEKLAQIYQNLARTDEDFHRVQIDAFVSALRNGGTTDRA